MNTVNERIQYIIDQKFNKNVSAFCRSVDIKQPTMNTILGERKSKPSLDIISKIINAEAFKINIEWLITGKGEPFMEINKDSTPRISYTSGVPYYNVDFVGGFDILLNDQTIIPEYKIDFQKYNDATCWCNVTGHSMEPEITHGDIIALKKIEDKSFLLLGEIYAIVTTNGMRTIKRLGPSSNPENYSLIPTNKSPEYGIQELPKNMIMKIFQVLGCMKRL